MVFHELEYVRPSMAKVKAEANKAIGKMKRAKSYADFRGAMEELIALYKHLLTAQTIVEIRHTVNTKDAFYDKEQEFFDSAMPKIMPVFIKYYQAILDSPYQSELEAEFGHRILSQAELEVKRFSKKLILPMIRDNKLASQYQKLLASCEIELLGEKRNLSGIKKLMQSPDRKVRR